MDGKNTSAKSGKSVGKYERKTTNPIAGNFLETICWEIRVDTSGFFMGVIMAHCYGIILRFQGNGTWSSVEHPSSTDLSRTMQSKESEVIGSVEQGDGDAQPTLVPKRVHGG